LPMHGNLKNQWKVKSVNLIHNHKFKLNLKHFMGNDNNIGSKRLLSLDAFRGFTIAAMILVNFPGSWSYIYGPLRHAEWNGLTPTDLIFPFFLFIVGVSIALAYTKLIQKGVPARKMHSKILFRTLKIFGLGLLLNFIHHFRFAELRYAGVLQRIAVVFLICSILFMHSGWISQLVTAVGLLVLYWLVMTLIPTPGYSSAMLEPGVNLAAWIDGKFLPGKMWQGTWDPEGILSTLPAIGTCIMGMLTGRLILDKASQERKIIWIFILGFAAVITGYIWSWDFPVNKNLWTSSYVLVTGGLAMEVLATLMFLVDALSRFRFARIGIVFGSNAITLYVLAYLLAYLFYSLPVAGASLNEHLVGLADYTFFSPKFLSLVYAFLFVAVNYIPAYWLFSKKIFIRL
jgi:predicted acyltransferase